MAEPFVWGSLARANNDATVIDEAIATAVTAHNNDADAHLADGQALQSHRAAEIIDHLAESVVNDKIRVGARTYLAIVGSEDGDDFTTIEDACDYAYSIGTGTIKIRAGTYEPVRDLKIAYGIDLVGEGPEETVVNLDTHDVGHLNFAQRYEISNLYGATFYEEEGVNAAEFYADGGLTPDDAVGGLCTDLLDDVGDKCLIIGVISGIEVEFYNPPAAGYGEITSAIMPTLTASTSSNIVTINAYKFGQGYANLVGLNLIAGGQLIGEIASYDNAGHFTLIANAAYALTNEANYYANGKTGRESIVTGITFIATDSDYLVVADGSLGRVFLRDCTFKVGGGFFKPGSSYSDTFSIGATVEDSIITFYGGAAQFNGTNVAIRNSTIDSASGGYLDTVGGYGTFFENCTFGIFLSTIGPLTRFEACSFTYVISGTLACLSSAITSEPVSGVRFHACTFNPTGTNNLYFLGNYITVEACTFAGGTGTVGLSSSSRKSIFSTNLCQQTIATQPTACLVTGNLNV